PLSFTIFQPLLTRRLRDELRAYDEALEVARQPWPGKLDSLHAIEARNNVKPPPDGYSLPMLDRLIGRPAAAGVLELGETPLAGMTVAMRRSAIATIAIERY